MISLTHHHRAEPRSPVPGYVIRQRALVLNFVVWIAVVGWLA